MSFGTIKIILYRNLYPLFYRMFAVVGRLAVTSRRDERMCYKVTVIRCRTQIVYCVADGCVRDSLSYRYSHIYCLLQWYFWRAFCRSQKRFRGITLAPRRVRQCWRFVCVLVSSGAILFSHFSHFVCPVSWPLLFLTTRKRKHKFQKINKPKCSGVGSLGTSVCAQIIPHRISCSQRVEANTLICIYQSNKMRESCIWMDMGKSRGNVCEHGGGTHVRDTRRVRERENRKSFPLSQSLLTRAYNNCTVGCSFSRRWNRSLSAS